MLLEERGAARAPGAGVADERSQDGGATSASSERRQDAAASVRRRGAGSPSRRPDGPIARVFPGWTLAVGNGYIFPDNPGKVRSLGGLPPVTLERPTPLAAHMRSAAGPQEDS